MKASSLTRHLIAATLFLVLGAAVARTQEPAIAPDAAQASLERVLRAAIEANSAQLRRFDRDQNGKLEDSEWRLARLEVQRAFAGSLLFRPTPGEEKRRLEAVAAEVARRSALRGNAAENVLPLDPDDIQRRINEAAAEIKRLEAVAAAISERRQKREETVKKASEPK